MVVVAGRYQGIDYFPHGTSLHFESRMGFRIPTAHVEFHRMLLTHALHEIDLNRNADHQPSETPACSGIFLHENVPIASRVFRVVD